MKQALGVIILAIIIIGIFRADILQALFFFLIVGAVPGTDITLGAPVMMTAFGIIAIALFAVPLTRAIVECIRYIALGFSELTHYYRTSLRRTKNYTDIPAIRRSTGTRRA